MKEYRLAAWPELKPPFDRTAYRRMLSDLSHRFMSVGMLIEASSLRRSEVRGFLDMLESRGLLIERDNDLVPDSQFWSLRPLGGWLRRAISSAPHGR